MVCVGNHRDHEDEQTRRRDIRVFVIASVVAVATMVALCLALASFAIAVLHFIEGAWSQFS
jgi:hypothetical protein